MKSRAIENVLARGLIDRGWEVRRSIDAAPKIIPFIMIETESIEPIHAGAPVNQYGIKITLNGKGVTPNDEDATSVSHLALTAKLGEDISALSNDNGVLNDRWTMTNCQESPPAVATINETEYWSSGFMVQFI